MAAKRVTVGFDRKIRLPWLDATADWAGEGLSLPEIRSRLESALAGEVAGEGTHSARGKTITVLLRIWVRVPQRLMPLRNDGLLLMHKRSGRGRLPLHWGMSLATYPFLRDVAGATGRLLSLQGTVATPQITRRIWESWGERSTVTRAVQRVLRSFVLWGVLKETKERGVFAAVPKMLISGGSAIGPWLLEAGIATYERQMWPFRAAINAPFLFPFAMEMSHRDLERNPRLEIHNDGSGEHLVTCRSTEATFRPAHATSSGRARTMLEAGSTAEDG
ncbi:MAG: hypothetical protein AB1486_05400 [Planctomycetota bacterium]